MSSRTELYDDVVDVTSLSVLDVVEINKSLSSSLSALDVVQIKIVVMDKVKSMRSVMIMELAPRKSYPLALFSVKKRKIRYPSPIGVVLPSQAIQQCASLYIYISSEKLIVV